MPNRQHVEAGGESRFRLDKDGRLLFDDRIGIPNDEGVKKLVFSEAPGSSGSVASCRGSNV